VSATTGPEVLLGHLRSAAQVVTVVAFDPRNPGPIASSCDVAVLVAAAERTSATAAATAAAWLRHLGIAPVVCVFAGVDGSDETSGLPSGNWSRVAAAMTQPAPVPPIGAPAGVPRARITGVAGGAA
jgi:hypothetical protein